MKNIKVYVKAENVRTILAKRNKNLTWFAGEVGISRCYLSFLLTYKRSPSAETCDKFQQILGNKYTWDDLFVVNMTDTTSSI